MELITKSHLSLILSCPSQLIDGYEKLGMPVIYIGDLQRYDQKKVFTWLKTYYQSMYFEVEKHYEYEVI